MLDSVRRLADVMPQSTKRIMRSSVTVLGAAVVAFGSSATSAWAGDWHATAYFPAVNLGGQVWLWSGSLHVGNPSTNFVTNELWDQNATGTHWIEAGIFEGVGSGGVAYDQPTFFWADNRYGHGYSEHDYTNGGAPLNAYYTTYIKWDSTNTWDVYIGGHTPQSTDNVLAADALVTGTEESTQNATACADQHGTSYWDGNGTFHSNSWPGSYAYLSWNSGDNPAPPPDVKWFNTAEWHDWSNDQSCY